MKALTVRDPWATFIARGYKDVENRSRRTHYRGPLAIHVAQRFETDDRKWMDACRRHNINLFDALLMSSTKYPLRGHIIAVVDLVDCVQDAPSTWAEAGMWHWKLDNARLVAPLAVKGRLGLWDVDLPDEVAA